MNSETEGRTMECSISPTQIIELAKKLELEISKKDSERIFREVSVMRQFGSKLSDEEIVRQKIDELSGNVVEINDKFTHLFFEAEARFKELDDVNPFFYYNPKNPNQVITFIANTYEKKPVVFLTSLLYTLKEIKQRFGPHINDKPAFLIIDKNIVETKIVGLTKDAHMMLEGISGHYNQLKIYPSREDAEKQKAIIDEKDEKYKKTGV